MKLEHPIKAFSVVNCNKICNTDLWEPSKHESRIKYRILFYEFTSQNKRRNTLKMNLLHKIKKRNIKSGIRPDLSRSTWSIKSLHNN